MEAQFLTLWPSLVTVAAVLAEPVTETRVVLAAMSAVAIEIARS
jgi:hypothetical protein